MANNKEVENDENVELLDEDEIITLTDDEGKPVDFYEVACIEYQGDFYALLQPVEPLEGLGEDEALIFKVSEEDEDNDIFEPVTDESILDAVFNEYLKALAEAEDDCCDCDCDECGHGDCDCEHDHDDKDCDCGCGHHHCKHE